MKHPIFRSSAAVAGGLTVLAAVSAGVIRLAGVRPIPQSAGWAIPLAAGAAVGLMSLFLLAGVPREDNQGERHTTTSCASCGMDVLEDWRLCPHCGGSNEPLPRDGDAPGVPTHIQG